jgi:hypothetical protein
MKQQVKQEKLARAKEANKESKPVSPIPTGFSSSRRQRMTWVCEPPRYGGKNVPDGKNMRDKKFKSPSVGRGRESAPLRSRGKEPTPSGFNVHFGTNWSSAFGARSSTSGPPSAFGQPQVESSGLKAPSDTFSFSTGPSTSSAQPTFRRPRSYNQISQPSRTSGALTLRLRRPPALLVSSLKQPSQQNQRLRLVVVLP